MKTLFVLIMATLLVACKEDTADTPAQDSTAPDNEKNYVGNIDAWLGSWRFVNEANGVIVAHLDFTLDDRGYLVGQYTLTKHFCQTAQKQYKSYCPGTVYGGNWRTVKAIPEIVDASAGDPFLKGAVMSLSLNFVGDKTYRGGAMLADAGRIAIAGELIPGPR